MQPFVDAPEKAKAKYLFDRQFTKNPPGYAHHGLIINEKMSWLEHTYPYQGDMKYPGLQWYFGFRSTP